MIWIRNTAARPLCLSTKLKIKVNNRSSPKNGQNKNYFTKPKYLSITNNEILNNSKLELKNSHSCVALTAIFHRCWDCPLAPGRMTLWCARRTSGWPRSTTRTRTPRGGTCSRRSTRLTSISAQSPPASVQVCCPENQLVMLSKFIFHSNVFTITFMYHGSPTHFSFSVVYLGGSYITLGPKT
jgi:hypothetical protein